MRQRRPAKTSSQIGRPVNVSLNEGYPDGCARCRSRTCRVSAGQGYIRCFFGQYYRDPSKGGALEYVHWATGTALLLPRLLKGRSSGPVFVADRRAPTSGRRAPAATDICPVTGRGRLSYPRAEYLFKTATAALDPHGQGGRSTSSATPPRSTSPPPGAPPPNSRPNPAPALGQPRALRPAQRRGLRPGHRRIRPRCSPPNPLTGRAGTIIKIQSDLLRVRAD